MSHHRFLRLMDAAPLPQKRSEPECPRGFTLVPAVVVEQVMGGMTPWQQSLYEKAFAEAQAVVRPSLLERGLPGVWN